MKRQLGLPHAVQTFRDAPMMMLLGGRSGSRNRMRMSFQNVLRGAERRRMRLRARGDS